MTGKELGQQPAWPTRPPLMYVPKDGNQPPRFIAEGLSLRQHYAGQAMQGLSVGCSGLLNGKFSAYAMGDCNAALAERAVVLADALLDELAKEGA